MKKPAQSKSKTKKNSASENGREDFLIVGIGASAGGIQALKTFFENVAADSDAAYVVILHLSPDHDSQLAEVLQRVASIPVVQVQEKMKVVPNQVYVVPPDRNLKMVDGLIVVEPNLSFEERRAPVDIFFRTLAESHAHRAVCVVLSGTGANGSMGMKRVKEKGGAVFVQNPREAEFSEMPRNSIATELVDEILNVAEIPKKILAYSKNLGKVIISESPEQHPEAQQTALREIFAKLRVQTGHDFSNYKRATVLRRIERRINVRSLPDLPSYAEYLKENSEETQALLKDLLISVTNFFRDEKAFNYLEREVVPRILEGKRAGDELRIWVAGCATGEEAYSLAMLFAEQTHGNLDAPTIQIFASDIDDAAIMTAREGFYTLNDAADVSPERLRRFFTEEAHGFRIRRELREGILFANHNLLKDPPFSRLDLVTCRNLLIYFNHTAQERVMETFHFALNPAAYLFLGTSESVDGASDLYAALNREERIYQSRQTVPRTLYPVADLSPSLVFSQPQLAAAASEKSPALERISYGELHGRLLEQYAPPSIIINETYHIVHLSERAGRFLQMQGGEPSTNLFELIRPEIRTELTTAVYQAVQRQTNVDAEKLNLRLGDRIETIKIRVRPVLEMTDDTARGFILIVFETTADAPDTGEAVYVSSEPINRQLEYDLINSQAQYRSSLEHSEVQAEELKASNEELQAMNEELRSATEELETGKEELQSINEELVTVNQELKIKIEELSQSNNDFQNLINSSNIGTIFLDRNFRVQMFTPAVREIFNLQSTDIGRPLTDITHNLEYQNINADVERVLNDLRTIEREIEAADGSLFLAQISPYRTSEDRISGAVISFVNITQRKRHEDELRKLNRQIEQQAHIFDTTLSTIQDFAYIFDQDGRFIYSNYPLLNLLGITAEQIVGKNFYDLNYPEDLAARLQSQIQRVFDTGETVRDETPFTSTTGAGGFYEYIFNPVRASDGTIEAVAGSTRDITAIKRREMNYAFLSDFSQELIALKSETEIVQSFGERISRLTGAAACAFFAINEPRDEAEITAEWHQSKKLSLTGKFSIPELVSDEFQQAMSDGETIVVRDISDDLYAKGKKQLASFGIGSFVNVPLIRSGEWKFVLGVYHSEPYDWRADEVELLTEAARRIWTKIESRRRDELLRDSEERLQQLIKNLPGGAVFVLDRSLRYLLAAGEALADGNFTTEDFIGKTIFEVLPGDLAETYAAMYRKALEGESFTHENSINGGTYITRGTPLRMESGEIYSVLAVSYDISERKQAEKDLRESEERFRAMFEQASVGIVQTTVDGRLIAPNPGFCQIIGYAEGEAFRLSLRDITHPDDYDREVELTRQLMAGEITDYSIEKRYLRKDGGIIWGAMTATLMRDVNGEPAFALAVVEDISERKAAEEAMRESQERLSLVIKSVEDYAIITTDINGIINGWNPGAEKIFGWTEDEITGRSVNVLFTPEDLKKGIPAKEMQKAVKKGSAEDERWHVRRDGSRFFVSCLMHPLKDGIIDGFVKIARDMTERTKIEQIKRDKEMLQKLVTAQEDERKRIARDLHDELGQLLTALRLKLESVRKLCEKHKDLCGKIDETQVIAKNIDAGIDFLAWELRPAALDDLGLRPALINYVREWSRYAGVTAELLGAKKLPRLSFETETNLYRIAQEALNNTHKHAKAKHAEVMLEKRGEMIVLIIEDDGKGFNPKSKKNRSKGLGLIGMQERAALIGGTVEIESSHDKGTTIFVRVPAVGKDTLNDE